MSLTLASSLIGAFSGCRCLSEESGIKELDGSIHHVKGYVSDVGYLESDFAVYTLKAYEIDDKPSDIGLKLTVIDCNHLEYGDEISFISILTKTDSEDTFLKSEGIFIGASIEAYNFNGTKSRDVFSFINGIRSFISNRFSGLLGDKAAAFASAILLGDRSELDPGIKLSMRRIGVSHILAVSGLHLSVIAGCLYILLKKLTVPLIPRNVILTLVIILFAFLTGLSESVIRASVMLILFYISELSGLRREPMDALFFAAAFIVCLSPYSCFDVGFLLSFTATLGIICVSGERRYSVERLYGTREDGVFKVLLKKLLTGIELSLACVLFTLPITYFAYGGISLLSVAANIVFIPMAELILYLLLFLAIISPVPYLSAAVAFIARFFINAFTTAAGLLSDIDNIYISLRYPGVLIILISLSVAVAGIILIRKAKLRWIYIVYAVSVILLSADLLYFGNTIKQKPVITFLNSSGNDMTLIEYEGKAFIIDTGNGRYGVMTDIAGCAKTEIDGIIFTDIKSGHREAYRNMLSGYRIRRLYLPVPDDGNSLIYTDEIADIAGDYGTETVFYSKDEGLFIREGGMKINVFSLAVVGIKTRVPVFTAEFKDKGELIYLGSAYNGIDGFEPGDDFELVIYGAYGSEPDRKIVMPDSGDVIISGIESVFVPDTDGYKYEVFLTEPGEPVTRIIGEK